MQKLLSTVSPNVMYEILRINDTLHHICCAKYYYANLYYYCLFYAIDSKVTIIAI